MEEIDLSFTPDYPMPPGIEEDDYDSEREILILKELLDNYSLSLPENDSFHFDIPSSSRPPAKPPDAQKKPSPAQAKGPTGVTTHLEYKYPSPHLEKGVGGVDSSFASLCVCENFNKMQTQMSNTLHNAIMEAGSKDRPPMLAP
nr:hypothetical protein [Tanacetum cinerariifolium]